MNKITNPKRRVAKIIGEQRLRELYWQEEKSSYEIAKMFGFQASVIKTFMKRHGIPLRSLSASHQLAIKAGRLIYPSGQNHWAWKGGEVQRGDGYIAVKLPQHPRADGRGYVRQHLLVWEQVHNMPLPEGWLVHHINGIRSDNRPENLLALPQAKHRTDFKVQVLQQRIRELEAKVKLMERSLDSYQSVSWSEN